MAGYVIAKMCKSIAEELVLLKVQHLPVRQHPKVGYKVYQCLYLSK